MSFQSKQVCLCLFSSIMLVSSSFSAQVSQQFPNPATVQQYWGQVYPVQYPYHQTYGSPYTNLGVGQNPMYVPSQNPDVTNVRNTLDQMIRFVDLTSQAWYAEQVSELLRLVDSRNYSDSGHGLVKFLKFMQSYDQQLQFYDKQAINRAIYLVVSFLYHINPTKELVQYLVAQGISQTIILFIVNQYRDYNISEELKNKMIVLTGCNVLSKIDWSVIQFQTVTSIPQAPSDQPNYSLWNPNPQVNYQQLTPNLASQGYPQPQYPNQNPYLQATNPQQPQLITQKEIIQAGMAPNVFTQLTRIAQTAITNNSGKLDVQFMAGKVKEAEKQAGQLSNEQIIVIYNEIANKIKALGETNEYALKAQSNFGAAVNLARTQK